MPNVSQLEERLLNASELELVSHTLSPAIETLSGAQLQDVTHRLRQAFDRAKDIGKRQAREIRGKADPRGTRPVKDNTGSVAKAQALGEALKRVEEELHRREGLSQPHPSQAGLSRHALEVKLSGTAEHHPEAGRSAAPGVRDKSRKVPAKIGTTRKEIGRVSQAGKVAQARKDAKH
jgi:hypothetical protein